MGKHKTHRIVNNKKREGSSIVQGKRGNKKCSRVKNKIIKSKKQKSYLKIRMLTEKDLLTI